MVPCADMSIQEIMRKAQIKKVGAYKAKRRGYYYPPGEKKYPPVTIGIKCDDLPKDAVSVEGMTLDRIKEKFKVSHSCALKGAKRGYIYPEYNKRKIKIDPNCNINDLYNFADMVIAVKLPELDKDDKKDARQEMVLRMYELSGVKNMEDYSFQFKVAWNSLQNWLSLNIRTQLKYFNWGLINKLNFKERYFLFYRNLKGEVLYSGIMYSPEEN